MKDETDTNWKEAALILAFGGAGGILSWIYAVTIFQAPEASGIYTLIAWMTFGMAASFLGVYLIANTDTRAIYRCLAFALLCGFSWKPTFEAAEALIDKQTAASRTQQLSSVTEKTRSLIDKAKQVPNDEFSFHAQSLAEKAQELTSLPLQVNDYNSRSLASLATREVVDLLVDRIHVDSDTIRLALDGLGRTAQAVGDSALAQYTRDAQSARVNWTLATAYPIDLPGLGDNVTYLSEILKAASRGIVNLRVLGPGKSVSPVGITKAVMEMDVEAGYTSLQYDADTIPAATLLSSRPFGMEPREFTSWWYDGGGRQIGETVYAAHRVKPILCGITGPETGGWFKKPITSIDDFKGLKIRFFGLGAQVMAKMGASVSMISGADIYPALEKGTIDATEFSTPAVDNVLGFSQVAKFNYFPAWQGGSSAFHLVVNMEHWDRLDSATHSLIEMGCTSAVVRNLSHSESIQSSALAESMKQGVNVRTFSDAILANLQRESNDLLKERASEDALFRMALESQRRFSNSYKIWKSTGYLPPED